MTLPKQFLDPHHHFFDTKQNGRTWHSFFAKLAPDSSYLAEDYHRDVIDPLEQAGVQFRGSVHLEVIPDDGIGEAEWIVQNNPPGSNGTGIRGIVASCDLARDASIVDDELEKLSKIDRVKGIRWILDCVGTFGDGTTATHVATTRHDGIDYLRGSEGGYEGQAVPAFEAGFGLLAKHQLTFDLQCAPAQLKEASRLCARHPDTKVVIDHLGKPRQLLGPDTEENRTNTILDEAELAVWREGMKCMAAQPNVCVKISMLGYAIPGWIRTEARIRAMKSLVIETIRWFGPERCMVATNFHGNAVASDCDGLSDVAPEALRLLELLCGFLHDEGFSEEDIDRVFYRTAKDFYGL